ncbi:MAG: hypothetical protein ACXADY_23815 [Candidatus Hodarchaeales archaeon]
MLTDDVRYVMSLPRTGFTDNLFCLADAVARLSLRGRRDNGVYWYQDMENMLEKVIEDGAKYALTIDFDTWFSPYHIIDLYDLMEKHAEYAALFPLQARRSNRYPMAGKFVDKKGDRVTVAKGGQFVDGVSRQDTGHFGLTMIRLSELEKLKKPWFYSKPNENKAWQQGKKDADVRFWLKCKREGLKVGLARVWIGHMELMCSFSGPEDTNFATKYFPINNIILGGAPSWSTPKSQLERIK